jgi:hypothetical protein
MTINVALATSDALVLGCDSIASTTAYFLDPMAIPWRKDAKGEFVKGAGGKLVLDFDPRTDFQEVVTNAWGGVTKLFPIHPIPSPVVAMTAGLAKLNNRPIASIAGDFFAAQEQKTKKLVKIDKICNAFLAFMREAYEKHYKDRNVPDVIKMAPSFLIGGYGRDDPFPSILRINVKENKVTPAFVGGRTGVSWNGQSDAVERFIRGYDDEARYDLRKKIEAGLQAHGDNLTKYFTERINAILDKLGATMPSEIVIKPPNAPAVSIGWDDYRLPLDYANLPLQEAVNFVSFLVMLQAGRARFALGVPTVGGRTHVGVVTREKGFVLLNEPELIHRHTGFGHDPQ